MAKLPSSPEWKLPARAPASSRSSISAFGTIAPVGSAITPVMGGGADDGDAGPLAARRAGDERQKARAKARSIANLQGERELRVTTCKGYQFRERANR